MFYFAYGSNMDWDQMKQRCPSAHFLGVAELRDAVGPGRGDHPVDGDAGRRDDGLGRLGHFRADAVAGEDGDGRHAYAPAPDAIFSRVYGTSPPASRMSSMNCGNGAIWYRS